MAEIDIINLIFRVVQNAIILGVILGLFKKVKNLL